MAWKVYDAMPGTDGRKAVYGPLPCKRWVKMPGEKKWKVSKRPAGPRSGPLSTDDQKAVQYARWLAAQDGVAIPLDGRAVVKWDGISTRAGKWSKRVFSVSFHSADGKWGQIILLPNWAFDPAEPIEETIAPDLRLVEMAREGWSILLQAA